MLYILEQDTYTGRWRVLHEDRPVCMLSFEDEMDARSLMELLHLTYAAGKRDAQQNTADLLFAKSFL